MDRDEHNAADSNTANTASVIRETRCNGYADNAQQSNFSKASNENGCAQSISQAIAQVTMVLVKNTKAVAWDEAYNAAKTTSGTPVLIINHYGSF